MSGEGDKKCGKCLNELPKNGDHVLCNSCNKGYHYGECSVKEKTWRAMGKSQEKWICALCRTAKKGSTSNPGTPIDEDVLENDLTSNDDIEVSSLGVSRSIIRKIDSLLEMKTKIDSIEKSMSFIADKYDKLLEEMVAIREENKTLKKELAMVKNNEKDNHNTILDLTEKIADLDQYGRRQNLEIHGIKEDPSGEQLPKVMEQVAHKIGVNYCPADINKAHRLQGRRDGKASTILIQFMSVVKRDEWLKAGRKAKLQNIYFNENLSQYFRGLLKETKARAKAHNYSYVWFQGGKVLVRKREGDKNVFVVRNEADLNRIGLNQDY